MLESFSTTQEFNERNLICHVVFNYLRRTQKFFDGKNINDLSKNQVKKYIEEHGVLLNYTKIYTPTFKITDGDEIEIPDINLKFTCINNSKYNDIELIKRQLELTHSDSHENSDGLKPSIEIDDFINNFLNINIGTTNLSEVEQDKIKYTFAWVINLFQEKGFSKIKSSQYSYNLTEFIKSKLLSSSIAKELDISKSEINFGGKLIEILIKAKKEKEIELIKLNTNLLSGHYDNSLFKYLQEYRKIHTTDTFLYLIEPHLNNNLSIPIAIENLIKPVNKSFSLDGIEPKFNHFEESKKTFDLYFELLSNADDYNKGFFCEISNYLFKILKENCEMAVEKTASIIVEPTNRKYNFTNIDRKEQEIFFVVSNVGEGLAKNVSIHSNSRNFKFSSFSVGILKPNEKREVSVIATLNYCKDFQPSLNIQFDWEELSGKEISSNCLIEFQLQKTEVPWEVLKKQNPYSFSIIENPDKLFGRDEILEELKSNILSDNIESYKLWGQKRVGKSSIVKTLRSILESFEKTIIIYRPLGGLRNIEAINTLNSLGKSLCSEIYEEIVKKIKDVTLRERLRSIEVPSFNGSLFPLEDYLKHLRRIDNSLKFVFILDEFDRINEEFFLPGNLGETLSLSIGKGLNENKFIGFILVGSENMHLLDRQGINYNSYRQKEVDTFNKQWEFESFIQIIKGPVSPYINFTDEAIDIIFNHSNGNPYFANLICAEIFKIAYKLKDSEIDTHLVKEAISLIINSSNKDHYVHYWSDGITEESNIKKERKADIRKRILICYSMISRLNENSFPTKQDIERKFNYPSESEYKIERHEVTNTITEFITRKILIEDSQCQLRIIPLLFEKWLCGIGRTLMIAGISDLEALQRELDLEKELSLNSDELNRLSEKYRFKGNHISTSKLTEYFKQFGSAIEQRRVFKLIDAIYYISKDEIVQFLKKEKRNIFSKKIINLKDQERKYYKENLVLYTFSMNYNENLILGETFKKLYNIQPKIKLQAIKSSPIEWFNNSVDEIIIIEPIIERFSDIQDELFLLLTDSIRNLKLNIRIVSLLISTSAKADLIRATSNFINLKLVLLSEVEDTKIKPFVQGSEIFENSDEANHAFFEVTKRFPYLSKDVLLVLFEDFCPSKSCPVLWFKSSEFNPLFYNEFGSLEVVNEPDDGEKRRDKLYFAAKEFSQKINRFMVNYLKAKAKNEGIDDIFHLRFIPRRTLDNVNRKWLDDNQQDSRETYFDFIDYKEIIKHVKDQDLEKKFRIGNKDQLEWMNKCNELRRDPAHPEKPSPTFEEVEFFENTKNTILSRLN